MTVKSEGRFEFVCTIAVSRLGTAVLVSQVPSDFEGWIVNGDFPEDDGWQSLPDNPGLYECRVSVRSRFDEPELEVVSYKPIWKAKEEGTT